MIKSAQIAPFTFGESHECDIAIKLNRPADRLAAMHKVFQMVLDSIEWTANDEQNQFRSYLFDLYKLFFSAVWVSGDVSFDLRRSL